MEKATSVLDSVPDTERGLSRFKDTPTENLWLVSWLTITAGLQAAVERYEATLAGRGTGQSARIAFGEALWWTAAAEEYLRRLTGRTTHAAWYGRPRLPESAKVLGALTYLRHLAGHQFADILAAQGESVTATAPVFEVDGRPAEPLSVIVTVEAGLRLFVPTPHDFMFSRKPGKTARAERWERDKWYDELVAGSPVLPTLQYVAESVSMSLEMSVSKDSFHYEALPDQ